MEKRVKQLVVWLLMFILIMGMLPAASAVGGEEDTVDVTMSVIWDDDDNYTGERPESVTVVLVRNGMDMEITTILSEANGWSDTILGLPAVDGSGSAYEYTVKEQAPGGYLAEYSGNAADSFVITNVKLTEIPDDPIPLAPDEQTHAADNTNEGNYLFLLLALSIVLFAGGTVLGRRRRKQKQ